LAKEFSMPRQAAKIFSNQKVDDLRARLSSLVPNGSIAITFGSYARREASEQSDIDYIIVGPDIAEASRNALMTQVETTVAGIVRIEPSADGAFAKYVVRDEMLRNLGGNRETNETLTRRMLLLLEGEWLSAETEFKNFRRELLGRYVAATPKDHQLALFLMNDIIRYWRTMTVDYMYKTTEGEKPWAIRNIKLIFSRKLMYASGLFSVGTTLDMSAEKKIQTLEGLFAMPAIERMEAICGKERIAKALGCYNLFLERVGDAQVREALKAVKPGDHKDPTFRELKNEGHRFTRELLLAFDGTFDSMHPIRRAIVF
jgi:hypothetical protein